MNIIFYKQEKSNYSHTSSQRIKFASKFNRTWKLYVGIRGSSEILLRSITCRRFVQHGPAFRHNEERCIQCTQYTWNTVLSFSLAYACVRKACVGIAQPHGSQRVLLTQACLHKSDLSSSSSFSAHRGHRWASHSRVSRIVLRITKSEELENLFPPFPSSLRGPPGTRVYRGGHLHRSRRRRTLEKPREERYFVDDDALERECRQRTEQVCAIQRWIIRARTLMGLIMRRCARACMGKVQCSLSCRYDRVTILFLRNRRINPNRNFASILNFNFSYLF